MTDISMSWQNHWLTVPRVHEDLIHKKLEACGMMFNQEFRKYYPGYNSIVTGKQHTSLDTVQFLFLGDDSNATMARLILG